MHGRRAVRHVLPGADLARVAELALLRAAPLLMSRVQRLAEPEPGRGGGRAGLPAGAAAGPGLV